MADLSPELTARIQSLEGSYADNPGRYFVALAGAWREAGEVGRAEEILRENVKKFPGLSAHVLLGRCLADRGAFPEAANEFHYVLSIDAQNLIALRTLAEMAAASGRRDEAEKWYNELLAVDPMNAEARASLAQLARGAADASVADQPVQVGSGWGGTMEPAPVAGGADAGDADEFGMIDLSTPATSPADSSGATAEDDDGEWGDLPLDMTPTAGTAPASAAPASDFDAFGFGSVDLDTSAPAPLEDDASAGWFDADARQDPGQSDALDESGMDDTLLDAPIAGGLPLLDADDAFDADRTMDAGLPLLDAGDTVDAGLPLLDAEPAGAPGFPAFDAPSHDAGGFPAFSAPADEQPAFAADAHGDDADHADHPVDAEVVTETMAELYFAQGLLQQAADTYRELIRQRGEEPGLVRRLGEIEARLGPSESPAAEAESPAPAEESAPDWLASVDAFAMGGAAAGLAAISMSTEPDPADSTPPAEPEAPAEPAEPALAWMDTDARQDLGESAAADHDLPAPEPAAFEAPVADFAPLGDVPPAPFDAAPEMPFAGLAAEPAGADASDSFADSFAGGFDGAEVPSPIEAAAPPAEDAPAEDATVVDDSGREAWEAPAVRETEPVGFDLIVVEEDGDEVPAPPEVVADVSADWAIAAAPLEDDEEAAEQEAPLAAPSGTSTMRGYFSSLLAWQPSQSAAPAIEAAPSTIDAAPAVAETPAPEPVAETADEPWGAPAVEPPSGGDAPAADDPWATPAAEPPSSADAPAADEPWASPAAEALSGDNAPAAGPAAADLAEEPWAEAPAPPVAETPAAEPAAADVAEEPWAGAPAASGTPVAEDEPWAAPAPDSSAADAGTAGGGMDDIPLMDLDEPWAQPAAAEPARLDAFELSDEISSAPAEAAAGGEEPLPWEMPAEPSSAAPAPAADAGGFSFEDFFSGSGAPAAESPVAPEPPPAAAPAPEPEPEPEPAPTFIPSLAFEADAAPLAASTPAPPPAAPPAPAASAPAAAESEEDEDLESFQAWLQSLKR